MNTIEGHDYESLHELIAATKTTVGLPKTMRLWDSSWIGREFSTWDDVWAAVESPWPEGIEALERMKAELANLELPKPSRVTRRARRSESNGDEIDAERLYSGDAAFWRESRREHSAGPQRVTVAINLSVNWKVKPEAVLWRGVAGLALADLFDAAGYSVQIIGASYSNGVYANGKLTPSGKIRMVKNKTLDEISSASCNTVVLKPFGGTADTAGLVNCLSGWCLRTVWMQLRCLTRVDQLAGNRGYATTLTGCERLRELSAGSEEVVVEGVYSLGEAVSVVETAVKRIGGPS